MGKIWFTSDTHFGHANIIMHDDRPFADVDEMDRVLISRWNDRVGPDDTVYHLGDFSLRNKAEDLVAYRKQLNGNIFLVPGNHDYRPKRMDPDHWTLLSEVHQIRVGDHRIVLCHYPMRSWDGSMHGNLHFFGHVHGAFDQTRLRNSMDVGVVSWGYRPINLEEILDRMSW
jgi:calcineurin-like phosphoesterase family protein